jgi:carbon-monoxide dehydrogenase medium subunit
LKDITYAAPKTVADAAALLSDKGDRARILAGGTDIIVQVREGRRDIDALVDIKHIPDVS